MKIQKILALMMVLMIAACTDMGGPITKSDMGALMGAAGGAAAGSQFGKGKGNIAMIALGTLGGAALGKSLGASLDKIDQQHAATNAQQTLETAPTGHASGWNNPDTGNSGTIVPTRTYQEPNGTYCREFTQTITVNGKQEKAFGKACRQSDGNWQIVSN